MTLHGSLANIEKLEADLWEAADNLRANSKLTSSEYCMPVLGIIFLRHAANRFETATRQIAEDQAAGRMPKRKIIAADYVKRRALFLPESARYDTILATPTDADLADAVIRAMTAIEESFEPLRGVLPKDFGIFERTVLEDLMRTFNREALRNATGDVFGRIYEYFLMKFAMQGAQDNGEFFTPPSVVQTLVNVIEPDHGVVADLACGSAGMFVQSSHFIEAHGGDTMQKVTFYGQEKTGTTIKLAKMNLAVRGLEGHIIEANTLCQDEHRLPTGQRLFGNVDFGMANPPFNVYMVDAKKVKDDPCQPFGLPGVNKDKKVSNGNYLWISYFHSYLTEGVPLIRSMNIYDDCLDSDGLAFISDEQAARMSNVSVQSRDILNNITGASVARCCMAPEWFVPARVNQHVMIIRVDPSKASPCVVHAAINSEERKRELLSYAQKGSTREALTKETLSNFEITLPSPELVTHFGEIAESSFLQRETLALQNQKLRTARDLLLPKPMSGEIEV